MSAISVTALECISSLGSDFEGLRQNLIAKKVGLSKEHRFKEWSSSPLGEIHFDSLDLQSSTLQELDCPFYRAIYAMAEKLISQTQILKRYRPERIGFFFGTSTSCLDQTLGQFYRYILENDRAAYRIIRDSHIHAATAKMIKKHFDIRGIDQTISTACSSSAHAISEGYQAIQNESIDAAIVGGFDILNEVTICGFSSLQILDSQFCRPFSKKREGTNLSEGGALLVLEKTPVEKPLALLVGRGASSDGYQMTQPDPEGKGMELSMRLALREARISAQEISYINAHGTGTELNDRTEAQAIHRIFGDCGKPVPVSSTKALHGHALGGSGAIEAAVSIAALLENKIWPSLLNTEELEYQDLLFHADRLENPEPIRYVLSNSFGFGGNNASLIFRTAEIL